MGSPGLKRERKKGRGRPFQPGHDLRRLEGPRKPFIKIRQRLSVITAERLSEPAPDDLCKLVRLPPGTSGARVVVEALLWEAGRGDVAAATALFEFTEAARSTGQRFRRGLGATHGGIARAVPAARRAGSQAARRRNADDDRGRAMTRVEAWLRTLSDEERTLVRYDWKLRARPEQVVPLDRNHPGYLYQCGRGWGKTLLGVETFYSLHTARPRFISHVVAPTHGDLSKVILLGPSGFLSVRPPELQPRYNAGDAVLAWSNGGRTLLFSAETPQRLRGPECDVLWMDELGVYRDAEVVFDNAMFGLRRGMSKFLITTTHAPTKMMKKLRAMPGLFIYQGSSRENRALSTAYDAVLGRYEGTRKERQEVFGELLEDNPGCLDGWTLENFGALRVDQARPLRRCFVGIDPAVTSHEDSDETGIVALGQGEDGHAYVLRDCSGRHQPERWARIAVNLYHELKADKIVAEGNNGGDLVASVIANVDPNVPVEIVHATRGKSIRAEPVSLWYHQRRAHHVGVLAELEDELAAFDPELWEQGRQASPNRMDALVWAFNPFCEGPSDTLGLIDWLKSGGAASILEPKPTRTPPPPAVVVTTVPDHGPCAACGYARLQELPGGNQLRCQQCGKQSWVDGRRPEVAVGRRNSAQGIGALGRWGDK